MYKQLTYLKDSTNQIYVGVKFTKEEMDESITIWESMFNKNIDSEVDDLYILNKNRCDRDGDNYHITLFSVLEYNKIKSNFDMDDMSYIVINDIIFEGIGHIIKNNNEAYYIVVNSDMLNGIRKDYGLDKKDLHITLGFNKKDVHGVSKGLETVIVEL